MQCALRFSRSKEISNFSLGAPKDATALKGVSHFALDTFQTVPFPSLTPENVKIHEFSFDAREHEIKAYVKRFEKKKCMGRRRWRRRERERKKDDELPLKRL